MTEFLKMLNELSDTNLSNKKKEILNKYKNNQLIKKIIFYTLNPFYKYWVSVDNINKYIKNNENKKIHKEYQNLFTLLNDLKNRIITWYTAIESVINFIEKNKNDKEITGILKIILNKDLWVNVWIWLINKIFKNSDWKKLIPEFKVQLATKLEDVLKKWENQLDFINKNYCASRKLDWVRVITIFNDNWTDVKFFSRQWNEFQTLQKLKDEFLKLAKENKEIINYVFDWEVCIVEKNWIENFTKIVWDIKKKDFTIKNPKYFLFDMIYKNEFLNEKWLNVFNVRYKKLNWIKFNSKYIEVLEQNKLDENKFKELLKIVKQKWWEWLIIKDLDSFYEWKRTKNIIKVKDFFDEEFKVINVINSEIPILKSWKMIKEKVMWSIEIDIWNWNIVNVWSWFSLEDRIYFHKNPNKIIWKHVTIKYFEKSKDKTWKESLRFPTFIWIRDYE